ncbi:hypothetical protein ACET3X_007916 [Alternaria dauci]|uniref:Uncharacterized protein n=1 Tax=Alternaria dauci TaxID=48095 RepID=A0ABR3UES1_9PLEO
MYVQRRHIRSLLVNTHGYSIKRNPAIRTKPPSYPREQIQELKMEHEPAPPTHASGSGSSLSHPSSSRTQDLRSSLPRDVPAIASMHKLPIPAGSIDAAVVHLTIALRAAKLKAEDALAIAVTALKNLHVATLMRAAVEWIKLHPWESVALLVPVVLMACTPAFLGVIGFTAGGVAAGSIAAGIQAGIGNVAAGSLFATLTSAGMAGYGAPVVFGGVGVVSSVVCWGFAAWKRWRKRSGRDDGEGTEIACRIRAP